MQVVVESRLAAAAAETDQAIVSTCQAIVTTSQAIVGTCQLIVSTCQVTNTAASSVNHIDQTKVVIQRPPWQKVVIAAHSMQDKRPRLPRPACYTRERCIQ